MTYLLLKAIEQVLEEEFKHTVYREPGTEESYKQPEIHIGNLPPKRKTPEQGQDFPFIVIRSDKGIDGDDGSTVDVDLVCGVYTAEVDPAAGMHDCQNMIDRIRRVLLERCQLDERYDLELPITWGVSEQDDKLHPRLYYLGWVGTKWTLPAVQQVQNINRKGAGYGEG